MLVFKQESRLCLGSPSHPGHLQCDRNSAAEALDRINEILRRRVEVNKIEISVLRDAFHRPPHVWMMGGVHLLHAVAVTGPIPSTLSRR